MSLYEAGLLTEGFVRIAGVDEAGRGPLAGPVVAAACLFSESLFLERLNDSKQLTARQREKLYDQITACSEIQYGIGMADAPTIDRINILQATFLAMQRAVFSLPSAPDYLLIDGNQLPPFSIPAKPIISGDALSVSIAAASILAKVTRDRLMEEYDQQWPSYGFAKHKGYGTKAHLEAIQKWGLCPIHRTTFRIKCTSPS